MASPAPQLYIQHKISGVYGCLHLLFYSCYVNVFIGSLPIQTNYQWSTKGVIRIANKKTNEQSVVNKTSACKAKDRTTQPY